MTDAQFVGAPEAPLALYLDLEPGRTADLEVVSRAALAWAAAIKEVAFQLDPSLELRIELASGTQGSLSLNSIIKSAMDLKDRPVTIRAVIGAICIWFGAHALDKGFDWIWDEAGLNPPQHVELTPEQKGEFLQMMERLVREQVAKPQVEQVYRELDRDPAIRGVGVTETPGARPRVIVPRSEFAQRGGTTPVTEVLLVPQRTMHTPMTVVLIRPVLLPGERRWGFRGESGEFGATIKDKEFIERTLSGTTAVPMVAGIEMDILLATKEEIRDGAWTVLERDVLHVFNLRRPRTTGNLFPAAPESDEADSADDDN